MGNYNSIWLVFLLIWAIPVFGQYKPEREHRIKKSQFPEAALTFVKEQIPNVRKKRYYQETDSSDVSYRMKFRKQRLQYRALFNNEGALQAIDFGISETDVPDEAMQQMTHYLDKAFARYQIRALVQQYVVTDDEPMEKFLRNAFQNLLLPGIRYEVLLSSKQTGSYADYEICFDSQGSFKRQRIALPPNFDHVLY